MFVGYSYDSSRLACLIPPIRFLWVCVLRPKGSAAEITSFGFADNCFGGTATAFSAFEVSAHKG
jgi:hypothetical protein